MRPRARVVTSAEEVVRNVETYAQDVARYRDLAARIIAERIAFDPEICGGRPRIAGTRVRVSDIIAALAEGTSTNEILEDYPYLSSDDISAALGYAAKAVDHRS